MKQHIRSYITQYPNSVVGFLNVIAEILEDLGDEWENVGKHQWAGTFRFASMQMKKIGEDLSVIRSEYEGELKQGKKTVGIIDEYKAAIRSNKVK